MALIFEVFKETLNEAILDASEHVAVKMRFSPFSCLLVVTLGGNQADFHRFWLEQPGMDA